MDRDRGKSDKGPDTVPQTEAAYIEDYKREVIAHRANSRQSLDPTAALF